jgi:hypothetical protein
MRRDVGESIASKRSRMYSELTQCALGEVEVKRVYPAETSFNCSPKTNRREADSDVDDRKDEGVRSNRWRWRVCV